MIKFLATLILILPMVVRAQWTQTNGIAGGYFNAVVAAGQNLIGATGNGTVFVYNGNLWSGTPSAVKSTSLHRSGNAVIALNYDKMAFSSDNGSSWLMRDIPAALSSEPLITDEAIHLLNSNRDSLYLSTDVGLTWNHIALSKSFTENGQLRMVFMFMKLYKAGNTIYAYAMTDDPVNVNMLLESHDSGVTWSVSFRPGTSDVISDILSDGNTTFVATTGGLYRKTGAANWVPADTGLPIQSGSGLVAKLKNVNGNFFALVNSENNSLYRFDPSSGTWISLDAPSFVSDVTIQNGTIVISTPKGISRIVDGNWISMTNGIIATTTLPVALSENVVFTQHGTTTYRTVNGGESWDSIAGPMNLIRFNGTELLSTSQSGIIRSNDLGTTWEVRNGGIPAAYIPKASDVAASGSTLYAGFNGTRRRDHLPAIWEQGGIYRSTDNGASWLPFNTGITHEGGVPAPVAGIHASDTKVLIRTIEGTYVLNGNFWSKIDGSFPANTYYSSVMISGDSIVLGTNNGLLISTNNGSSWSNFKSGLQESGLGLFSYSYFKFLGKYYAYDYNQGELYKLNDTTWQMTNPNLPQDITGFGFSSAGNVLYVGTLDRGIWKYTNIQTGIEEAGTMPTDIKLDQNYPNPFNPSTVISFTIPAPGNVTLKVFNVTGELVAELINGEMQPGNHSVKFDASNLNSGVYLYTLSYGSKIKSGKMMLLK